MRVERRQAGRVRWAAAVVLTAAVLVGRGGAAGADGPSPLGPAPVPAPTPVPSPVPTAPAPGGPAGPAVGPAASAEKPVVWTLDKAVAKGLVSARGENPGSYASVDLVVTNKSGGAVRVDVSGHHLEPTTSGCQRLGLSHPVTPGDRPPDAAAGTWPIVLGPGEVRRVRMNTCCMDSGRPCPRSTDKFVSASSGTAPKVEAALRWWVDHPKAPQGFVNAAIWMNDLQLLERPYERREGDGPPVRIEPKGRIVRSYAGIVYTLVDGVLTSVDTEGVRRFHGTQMYDVLPRADALYAVGRSATGYDLWRFGPTGDPPWGRVFEVRLPDLEVIPVGGGAYVSHARDESVMWRATKAAEPASLLGVEKATRFSIGPVDAAKGRYAVVVHQRGTPKAGPESQGTGSLAATSEKFVVFDVDGRTGKSEIRKVFWNARDMVAGPGGVFALSPVGTPERLDGEKLRRLPTSEEFASIVAAGTSVLVLRTKDGALVAYDVKTGKSVPMPASLVVESLSIDPVTDDLVWVGEHDFLRWRVGSPDAEAIP